MLLIHALFLTLFVGTSGFFTVLGVLNVRHGERTVRERSQWVTDTFGVEDVDELLDYHRLTTGASLVEEWATVGTVLLVLYSGLLGSVVEWFQASGVSPLAQGVGFFAVVIAAQTLVSLPFDAFETFGVEEAFDFNEQSPRLWARDTAVNALVTSAIALPLLAVVLWLFRTLPNYWWLVTTGVFGVFVVLLQVLVPRVVMPLFYDFDPVESGDLYEAIEDVFERTGFSCSQIYTMNASSRSSHANAFFAGFGRTKRVVLFDTLVEQMDLEAIQGVLAHELAHWKRHHVWKQSTGSVARVAVALLVADVLTAQSWLVGAFGVPGTAYAELLVAALWLFPLFRLTAPIENRLSLKHEREADDFAADVMGSGRPLADGLRRLTSENLTNPFPHPAYATWHYDHPPIPERIRRLSESGAD